MDISGAKPVSPSPAANPPQSAQSQAPVPASPPPLKLDLPAYQSDQFQLGNFTSHSHSALGSAQLNLPFSEPADNPLFKDLEPPKNGLQPRMTDNRRFEFFNPSLSDKAIISVHTPAFDPFQQRDHLPHHGSRYHDEHNLGTPKLRSPWLKEQAKELAETLISDPIENAWESKEITTDSLRAAALGTALLAGALSTSSGIKSSLRVWNQDMGGMNLGAKAGIQGKKGDVGFSSVGLNLRPQTQNLNDRWGLDLKYDLADKDLGLTYSRFTHHGGSGFNASRSAFEAGIYYDKKTSETKARVGYHVNF